MTSGSHTRWRLEPATVLVGAFGLAVVVGSAIVLAPAVAFGLLGLVLLAAALSWQPTTWIAVAVVAPWVIRPFAEAGLVPRAADFIDFPLVALALVVALSNKDRNVANAAAALRNRVVVVMVLFGIIVLLSAETNGSGIMRAVAGIALTLEPFALIVAILFLKPDEAKRRWLLRMLVVVGLLQLPVALFQWLTTHNNDSVRGTLVGAGAGAHVMAGGLILVGLVAMATFRRAWLGLTLAAVALMICVFADAKAVLLAAVPAIIIATLASRTSARRSGSSRRLSMGLMIGGAVFAVAVYGGTGAALNFLQGTVEHGGGKTALAKSVVHDVTSTPQRSVVGFGPGETVSRLAFLTTPSFLKEGSPVEWLGLRPGSETARYERLVADAGNIGSSSFTGALSSALGVIGDYGFAGAALVALLFALLALALLRSADALAPSALGGLAMVLMLSVAYDWLEQPPFVLILAMITGLALANGERRPQQGLPDATPTYATTAE